MRIRSIKPEFWRSKDISNLPPEDRLLFIGLWSYVDDNGVGRGELSDIVADLFADDMFKDPRETVARVSRGLARLSEANLIRLYEVENRPYLSICSWSKHQRIDKPAKARYPQYSADSRECRETVARVSEIVAPGTGEQGNRGTGEQGNSSAPTVRQRSAPRDPTRDDAGAIVGEWIDTLPARPPGRVIGQVAKEVKAMLDEGVSPDLIRRGVTEWQRRGLHPSTLASVVHEVSTPHQRGHRNGNDVMADIRRDAYQRTAQQGNALNLIEGGLA